jgi:hypothetical protein
MDVVEFFQQSAGKWFSQRTSYYLSEQQPGVEPDNSRTNIEIDLLELHSPDVIQVCQHHETQPEQVLCGARVSWDGTKTWGGGDPSKGSTVLIVVADADDTRQGKVLREKSPTSGLGLVGRYALGADEALTLITENDTMYSEERIWFASPNLRLRTNLLKRSDGFQMSAFWSEIRMGLTAPPADS